MRAGQCRTRRGQDVKSGAENDRVGWAPLRLAQGRLREVEARQLYVECKGLAVFYFSHSSFFLLYFASLLLLSCMD